MVEVKADALEQSFEQFEEDGGVAALKVELETLKAKIAAGEIAAQRPALDGVKSAEASAFERKNCFIQLSSMKSRRHRTGARVAAFSSQGK